MKFARGAYLVAGIYGLIVLLPQYFLEEKTGRDYPPPITHPEYFYGFVGVALAWQLLFLIVSRDPVRYRPVMIPAILEKLTFGGAAIALFALGRLAPVMLGAGLVDLVFAVLFLLAYIRTPSEQLGA